MTPNEKAGANVVRSFEQLGERLDALLSALEPLLSRDEQGAAKAEADALRKAAKRAKRELDRFSAATRRR